MEGSALVIDTFAALGIVLEEVGEKLLCRSLILRGQRDRRQQDGGKKRSCEEQPGADSRAPWGPLRHGSDYTREVGFSWRLSVPTLSAKIREKDGVPGRVLSRKTQDLYPIDLR